METVMVVGGAIGLLLVTIELAVDLVEKWRYRPCAKQQTQDILTPVGRMLQARATRESQALQATTPQNTTRRAA